MPMISVYCCKAIVRVHSVRVINERAASGRTNQLAVRCYHLHTLFPHIILLSKKLILLPHKGQNEST